MPKLTEAPIGEAPGDGVVKSLGLVQGGPVGLVHTQNFGIEFEKPTSVVETYKTTYRHKADIRDLGWIGGGAV